MATKSVSRAVAELYVRRANESLLRHFASPESTCDWCTAMWRHVTPYPCLPAQVALAINDNFADPAP